MSVKLDRRSSNRTGSNLPVCRAQPPLSGNPHSRHTGKSAGCSAGLLPQAGKASILWGRSNGIRDERAGDDVRAASGAVRFRHVWRVGDARTRVTQPIRARPNTLIPGPGSESQKARVRLQPAPTGDKHRGCPLTPDRAGCKLSGGKHREHPGAQAPIEAPSRRIGFPRAAS